MESQRMRVEQKGRFTITEIIPGSPNSSSLLSSPTFKDDQVAIPASGEVRTISQPQPEPPQQVKNTNERNEIVQTALNGGIELVVLEKEEMPDQTAEATVVPIEPSVILASDVAMDPIRKQPSLSDAISAPASAPGSPTRKYSSPKRISNESQRARRIKRRGRFTIIEMACDSPSSRKNSDELFDHRFVTTTSVKGSSVGSLPYQVTRSLNTVERRTKPKRAVRSMPRIRQPSSMRRPRRRSQSPPREFVDSSGPQEATAHVQLQTLSLMESTDALASVSFSTTLEADTDASTTSSSYGPSLSRFKQELDVKKCSRSLTRTSSMSISVAQFLQQQQTIASLIRQQHDLKQIINVLQEQQQQLMVIPSQINELKRQSASFRMRDQETRELHVQINSLTRANESLYSLLNAAEQEVRHRKLQMEYLTEENDELRHRCGQLELCLHALRLED